MSLGILPLIAALVPIAASVAVPLFAGQQAKKDQRKAEKAYLAQQDAERKQAAELAAQRAAQTAALTDKVLGVGLLAGAGWLAYRILGSGKARPKRRARRRR